MPRGRKKKNENHSFFKQWDTLRNKLRQTYLEVWEDEEIIKMDDDNNVEYMLGEFSSFLSEVEQEIFELKEIIEQKRLFAAARKELGFECCYLLDFLSTYDRRSNSIISPSGYWYNGDKMIKISAMKTMFEDYGDRSYLENAINFIESLEEEIRNSSDDDCHPAIREIVLPVVQNKIKELKAC